MDNFKTDNQDKSNLVGDVMSDAVDREKEIIRLKCENRELRMELALERAKAVSRNEFIAHFLKGNHNGY